MTTVAESHPRTILDLARAGLRDEALALVQTGRADANEARDGSTPALITAFRGWGDVVEALVAQGADLNVASELGETPLMKAVRSGKCPRSTIEALLKGGAVRTIDAPASVDAFFPGWTALHLAADANLSPDPGILALLLLAGADPDKPCASGQTARDVAKQYPRHAAAFSDPHATLKQGPTYDSPLQHTGSFCSQASDEPQEYATGGALSPAPAPRGLQRDAPPSGRASRFSAFGTFFRGRAKSTLASG